MASPSDVGPGGMPQSSVLIQAEYLTASMDLFMQSQQLQHNSCSKKKKGAQKQPGQIDRDDRAQSPTTSTAIYVQGYEAYCTHAVQSVVL